MASRYFRLRSADEVQQFIEYYSRKYKLSNIRITENEKGAFILKFNVRPLEGE